ncbi:DUF4190 domain-containing protein [Aquibacillus halophilus]|uniref:DUF4190 domain-containing protein n=1 Tax=Aquibacillus halophilus TaxID=930132 RepID=A0A6A8D6G5_9BACI|nr:DUF4190 domain-containing protein [Aquibacillus halophilus]MRH41168.1 DUF4190 domain-containing protein [Aquibacillus halophilus]
MSANNDQPKNGIAVISVVLGATSFFTNPFYLISIIAIVLGFIALNKIKQTNEAGKGIAITGIILGFANALLVILI